MAGKEKNKAAGKETPAASESVESAEAETDDALTIPPRHSSHHSTLTHNGKMGKETKTTS